MFNETWWNKKNKSKKLTIGWLYNNNIKDDFAKGYTKNLTDYWTVEMGFFVPNQFAGETIDDLLKQAYDSGFAQMIVFKQGSILKGDKFYDEFRKFYTENKDAKFIGHILDNNESYYRVHPQAFFIDLNWWADAGFPEWGEQKQNSPFETIEPIRSEENHHDQYTPHWIAPSKKLKTYSGKREGWNIVKSLIESGEKILSWSHECRVTKHYAYEEVKEDGPRHRADTLTEATGKEVFFIANTENLPTDHRLQNLFTYRKHTTDKNWNKKFQHVITPAAGLSTLFFAFKLGLKAGDRITIYDCSATALRLTHRILHQWSGEEYTKFAEKLMKQNINTEFRGHAQLPNVEQVIEKLNKIGFSDWIKNELSRIDIDNYKIDILNEHKQQELVNLITGDEITYLHLTNIFHYAPTAFYYSLQQRWQLFNDLLIKLKKRSNNNNILLYAARGPGTDDPIIGWIDYWDPYDFYSLSEDSVMRLLKWNK